MRETRNITVLSYPQAEADLPDRMAVYPEPSEAFSEPEAAYPESGIGYAEPEVWPEPAPDWPSALQEFDQLWYIHVFLFGACFTLIAVNEIISLASRCRFIVSTERRRLNIMSLTLNALLVVFGLSRSVALYTDPYGAYAMMPFAAVRLLWSVGYPCLTAAFTLVLMVLLETTKKTATTSPAFRKPSVILSFIGAHFVLVICSDVIVYYTVSARVLLLICQIIYCTWGLLLAVGYAHAAMKIRKNLSASMDPSSGASNKTSVTWLTQLLVTASVTALALFTVHLYGAFGVFGVYSEVSHVQNWPWWVFQTLMRGIEVTICLIVILIASKTPSSTGFAVVFRTVIQVRKKCRLKNAVIPMEDTTHPTNIAMNTQVSET
ncbi:uncharacterized protein LOC106170375 [Lingula anatina]|uniref:Uncharacterized protein LOC106170375 n=1 Tax=Lingula anatina TaxID=7574 RepID=A0A2R2MQU9_LINAN|nr:uncharacterized protein LOC106170375 [Lingula anatina]|eukprot:XP_023932377.1 uncharacterized protein LOC106170375 [Lingula anatina]